jgi:glycosyltransferase involved in cell wall biosynthesis
VSLNVTVSEIPLDQQAPRYKICHVAATTEGATWMFEQLRELRDRYGHDVTAVVSGPRGKLIDKLKSENIPYHVVNFAASAGPLMDTLMMPLAVLKLALFFRRERFDVVQSHIFISMRIARPAAWLADVPVRISMIAGPFHLEAPATRRIERLTYWMETILLPSCEKSVKLCRDMGASPERLGPVIYYGPDERRFDPDLIPPVDLRVQFGWDPDTPIVCMVAHFYPRLSGGSWVPPEVRGRGIKGHSDLIQAVPIILKEFPSTKFLLVGAGWGEYGERYLEEMKNLVQELRLEGSVFFPGHREDVSGILRAADIAVQASLNENLGGTIESLLLARPTVATRVGGLVDAVRDGETGVLVNPSDSQDLARGIIELLREPKNAAKLAEAGRKLMLERFTLRRTVSDLHALYSELSRNRRQQRPSYNSLVPVVRCLASVPLFAYLATRLFFVDGYLFYLTFQRATAKLRHPLRRTLPPNGLSGTST